MGYTVVQLVATTVIVVGDDGFMEFVFPPPHPLVSGALLGLARMREGVFGDRLRRFDGFLPWDDDVDVAVDQDGAERIRKKLRVHARPDYSTACISPTQRSHLSGQRGLHGPLPAGQLQVHLPRRPVAQRRRLHLHAFGQVGIVILPLVIYVISSLLSSPPLAVASCLTASSTPSRPCCRRRPRYPPRPPPRPPPPPPSWASRCRSRPASTTTSPPRTARTGGRGAPAGGGTTGGSGRRTGPGRRPRAGGSGPCSRSTGDAAAGATGGAATWSPATRT